MPMTQSNSGSLRMELRGRGRKIVARRDRVASSPLETTPCYGLSPFLPVLVPLPLSRVEPPHAARSWSAPRCGTSRPTRSCRSPAAWERPIRPGRNGASSTARAIVFRKGDVSVAVVSLDLLGFPSVLGDRVRARVSRIPAENILIGSTHTHSAPDCYAFPDGKGGHTGDLNYMDLVATKAAEAVNEAIDKLQPATIKIATGEAEGKIAYNYYAPDLYDRRMSVIQAKSLEGKTIATLVNYAIHPEVLGNDIGICSPDLIGPLCEDLEAKAGGHGPVHEQCPGGHGHGRQPRAGQAQATPHRGYWNDARSWEECLRIGRLMGSEALRIVKDAPEQKDPTLFCDAMRVRFPVESDIMWAVIMGSPLKYPHNDDRSINVRINLVNLGNAQILTIPGEALPNIGFYLKRKMHGHAQPALRPDQRGVRLHPHQGRFPQLPAVRLRLADLAGRDDRRDPDREVAGVREQVAGAGSVNRQATGFGSGPDMAAGAEAAIMRAQTCRRPHLGQTGGPRPCLHRSREWIPTWRIPVSGLTCTIT